MALQVYNYMTRQLELFKPIEPGRVKMYVCGPTVYDHSHLGHAKTYISMDVMVRYFKYLGYQVRHVRNLTDVGHLLDSGEDRILKGARRERLEPMEIVESYIASYFADMDALGVLRPNISPRPSGHIPEIIEWIEDLMMQGYAYEVDGNVYFSVQKFPEYGKLANRVVEEMEAGARVEVREEKRHPADFALWKKAPPEHLMRWKSPWGEGYPGWHIECSVMATKYLSQPFDVHGGGLENIFPHNECESAQAEAHSGGSDFAHYWLLVGSLTVNGVRMGKSMGNFITIKDALKLYSPEAIRYFVLSSHYRGPVDFSRDALEAAEQGVSRLHNTVRKLRSRMEGAPPAVTAMLSDVTALEEYRESFQAAMDEDFNTPKAMAVLFDFIREVNRQLDQNSNARAGTLAAMDRIFRDTAGKVLGILPDKLEAVEAGGQVLDNVVRLLLEMRQEFRAAREWQRADDIRDRLAAIGVMVEDGPSGSTWRLA